MNLLIATYFLNLLNQSGHSHLYLLFNIDFRSILKLFPTFVQIRSHKWN
jgi:hypothetical protein